MYCSLGNINFQLLKGFNVFDDEQESVYAQHNLIESKPRLQRMGDALQTFDLSIKFHVAFCNPEVEFDNLNKARVNGTVLALVYGNGYYEGDFVITKIKRSPKQTDNKGSYVEVDLDISILEFYDPNKLITKQEREKLSAFATDVARPLPAGTPKVDNTLSAQLYKYQMQIRNATVAIDNKFNHINNQLNQYLNAPNAIIGQGQTIVNVGANMSSVISVHANTISTSVNAMHALLSGSSSLNAVNPAMAGLLTSVSGTTSALLTALAALVGLPPVTNPTDGASTMALYSAAQQANENNKAAQSASDQGFVYYVSLIASRLIRL